ncbi:unnamed protein product [Brachionus calyciflorus]|uniref:Coiled-coil domain-containing protein 39 n=1 Tax=Brachionus calyciflorus TaxID=104777 RepID=A0A813WNK5_9BILA|nr:unnamed protein product [Brachionus calyciflorus]
MDEVLNFIQWDDNIALPVANSENKLLEEAIAKKTQDRNKYQNELTDHVAKTNALREHIKYVKDELLSNQNLLNARKNELITESHLKSIAERENGRLNQENQRLAQELAKIKEKRNVCENEIFLANQQFESMKSQMKWDQQALEAWLEESAQKDEDALTLKKYAKEDEAKIKELTLKIEKLIEQSNKLKKNVDDENLNTITLQVELDKTAEEFRKTHRDRQELIRQWEDIIEQMQKRDKQIESSAQQLMKMNLDFQIGVEELDKKKKFYEDQQNSNSKLEKEIESYDNLISELSIRLNREELDRQQFQNELGALKRTVERTGHDLQKARSDLSQLKKNIAEKQKLIESIEKGNKDLVEDLKETIETTLSAEENAKRMEEFFLSLKQKENQFNKDMKKKSEQHFKITQELDSLRTTQRNLEAEINGCDSTLKNLENRINRLDHESLKQAEVIYGQDFTIQSLERRMNRLQGETNNDELVELEKKIAELKKVKEEKRYQFDTLMNQFKRVEDETRKSKREIEELNKEKNYIDTKTAELTLHIDTAQRLLEKIIVQKQDLMVNENIKKLDLNRLRDILDKRADEVLNLNKERITMESGMKERFAEINIHQDLLKTQLRSWNEELQTVSTELKERMSKVEKQKKRYEILMVSMAPPEGTPAEENSQAYYVIKAAQEKEELQRKGDELDAKIKKAEKELRALENTLSVVNSNNESCKQLYSKADNQSETLIQKEELEQQLRSLSDTYKNKRKLMKQLEEDLQRMEDAYNSMNNDERTYEEYIEDKKNKILQAEKDIEQLKEKIERATKQMITYSRDLRRSKNSDGPTLEEKDFKLRDLWDFNKNKAKELIDISLQYPLLQQTLNLLFAQANIPVQGGTGSSLPGSSRSSRSSSRRNSASSNNSTVNLDRASVRSGPKTVNIGFDLPPTNRSNGSNNSKDGPGTPGSKRS